MKVDADRFVTAEVGGDVFLVDEENGQSFRLGGCAGRVWALLLVGSTPGAVAATIATETGAALAEVGADVDAFVSELIAAGIVTPDP